MLKKFVVGTYEQFLKKLWANTADILRELLRHFEVISLAVKFIEVTGKSLRNFEEIPHFPERDDYRIN